MHFHFAILAKTLWKSTAFFASNIFSPFDTSNYPWNIKVLTLPLYNFIQRQSYSEIRINCHHHHLALIIFSCLVRAWSNSKIYKLCHSSTLFSKICQLLNILFSTFYLCGAVLYVVWICHQKQPNIRRTWQLSAVDYTFVQK